MSEPFLGQIQMFGFNFPPRGWAKCDGQLLPISQNSALFSLLGTIYGGDGRTTFGLPDLRGRAAIHEGNGPGLNNRPTGSPSPRRHENFWADDAGVASGTYHTGPATGTMAAGAVTTTVANAGGAQSHENMSPFLTVNFCIALTGVFPSRN